MVTIRMIGRINVSSNGIINEIYTSDDAVNAKAFSAGPIAVGDYEVELISGDHSNKPMGRDHALQELLPHNCFLRGNYYTAPAAINYLQPQHTTLQTIQLYAMVQSLLWWCHITEMKQVPILYR